MIFSQSLEDFLSLEDSQPGDLQGVGVEATAVTGTTPLQQQKQVSALVEQTRALKSNQAPVSVVYEKNIPPSSSTKRRGIVAAASDNDTTTSLSTMTRATLTTKGTDPLTMVTTPQNIGGSYYHESTLQPGPSNRRTRSSSAKRSFSSRSQPKGIARALSRLSLCGNSARENTLSLEYMVIHLRQALTGNEASKALEQIVTVLQDSKDSNITPGNESYMMSTSELQQELVGAGADHCIISTLWNFSSHVRVQHQGIVALGELVAHSQHNLTNQKSIVLKGGIEVVLAAMKTHILEEALQEEACRTLKNIMKYNDDAKQQVARQKGISLILQAMMTHPEYTGVQRQACYALTSLACLKPMSDEIVSRQGHFVLMKTMQHHNDDPYVLAEGWRTLTNVVIHAMNPGLDEAIAGGHSCSGLNHICQSLQKFADCTVVPIQARGLTLLSHLCYRSPRNLERVSADENLEVIHRILQIWKYDDKTQQAGEKLVRQISHVGRSLVRNKEEQATKSSVVSAAASRSIASNATGGASFGGSSNHYNKHKAKSKKNHSLKSLKDAPIISQIESSTGLDVIVDTSMFYCGGMK